MATYTWVGPTDGDDNFSTAANWSPSGPPSSGDEIVIDAGASVTLDSDVSVGTISVAADGGGTAGTVSFTGDYTITATSSVSMVAGSTLELGSGTTLADNSGSIVGSGAGTYTISGGTFTSNSNLALGTGQTLVLSGTNFSTSSVVSGDGALVLDNGATATFNGSPPTVDIEFGSSGSNELYLTYYPGSDSMTVTDFGVGDKIHVAGNSLEIVDNGDGTYSLYDTTYGLTLGSVTLADGVSPGDFTMEDGYLTYAGAIACFCAGTMIAVPGGAVAVEALRPGDQVLTADGRAMTVRRLGHAKFSTRFADKLRVLPIRIRAGALGEGIPARDLLLSPDHAVFLRGVLVQAGALVNGASIIREENVPDLLDYYHVELESHELLGVEGAFAESFVDHVYRMKFSDGQARPASWERIAEMDCPRVKSARQLPPVLRLQIAARIACVVGPQAA